MTRRGRAVGRIPVIPASSGVLTSYVRLCGFRLPRWLAARLELCMEIRGVSDWPARETAVDQPPKPDALDEARAEAARRWRRTETDD